MTVGGKLTANRGRILVTDFQSNVFVLFSISI